MVHVEAVMDASSKLPLRATRPSLILQFVDLVNSDSVHFFIQYYNVAVAVAVAVAVHSV